ncbi:MAG: hypothetical protein ABI865_06985 [Nitrosospira sp.]
MNEQKELFKRNNINTYGFHGFSAPLSIASRRNSNIVPGIFRVAGEQGVFFNSHGQTTLNDFGT